MNQIAIAIRINQHQIVFAAQGPTYRALKVMARLKLARLKQKVNNFVVDIFCGLAINRVNQMAMA